MPPQDIVVCCRADAEAGEPRKPKSRAHQLHPWGGENLFTISALARLGVNRKHECPLACSFRSKKNILFYFKTPPATNSGRLHAKRQAAMVSSACSHVTCGITMLALGAIWEMDCVAGGSCVRQRNEIRGGWCVGRGEWRLASDAKAHSEDRDCQPCQVHRYPSA
jgi:hypothetical protein